MNVAWDYTKLAAGYVKRANYSPEAINEMLKQLNQPVYICDIGAGDAHLTLELLTRGKKVVAVEPNDEMRANGIAKTQSFDTVSWFKGTGEETYQPDAVFDAVMFGSSFNVCDQMKALSECKRITKQHAGFACMWNHRDLNNDIQAKIEAIIKSHISHYDYGNRRQDQTEFLKSSGYLSDVAFISGTVSSSQSVEECVEAWRSHGTLHRQCKDDTMFNEIIAEIESYLVDLNVSTIEIPYTTRIWTGKFL